MPRPEKPAAADDAIDPRAILVLVDRIKPMLHGKPPMMQGAALAELLSLWLVGHLPQVREDVLKHHIRMVRDLARLNAKILRGEGVSKH